MGERWTVNGENMDYGQMAYMLVQELLERVAYLEEKVRILTNAQM